MLSFHLLHNVLRLIVRKHSLVCVTCFPGGCSLSPWSLEPTVPSSFPSDGKVVKVWWWVLPEDKGKKKKKKKKKCNPGSQENATKHRMFLCKMKEGGGQISGRIRSGGKTTTCEVWMITFWSFWILDRKREREERMRRRRRKRKENNTGVCIEKLSGTRLWSRLETDFDESQNDIITVDETQHTRNRSQKSFSRQLIRRNEDESFFILQKICRIFKSALRLRAAGRKIERLTSCDFWAHISDWNLPSLCRPHQTGPYFIL